MGSETTTLPKTTAPAESESKESSSGQSMAPPAFGLTSEPIQRETPEGQSDEKTPEEALAELKALTGEPLTALLKKNTDAIKAKGFWDEDMEAISSVLGIKPAKKTFDEAMMEKLADWQYAADPKTAPTGYVEDAFYSNATVISSLSQNRFKVDLQKSDTGLATIVTNCKAAVQKLVDDKKITASDWGMIRMILANTPDLVKKTGDSKKHADDSITVDGQLVKFIMQFQTDNGILATGVFDETTFAAFNPQLIAAKANLSALGYTDLEAATADMQTAVKPDEVAAFVDGMIASKPTTNALLAKWLWDAAKLGFLTLGGRAKEDLLQLMSGADFNRMTKSKKGVYTIHDDFDTSGALLTGIQTARSIVLSYLTTWKTDMTKPKQVLGLNSLATWDNEGTANQRRDGQHGNFQAMDYAVVDGEIEKFKGILAALPKGRYGLGIGIMSGFYHHPEYNVNDSGVCSAIDTQKQPMDQAYGKVTDLDEVLKTLEKPDALTAVPEIGGGSSLSDTDREGLKTAIQAYIDAKKGGNAASIAGALAALNTKIAKVKADRDGADATYSTTKTALDAVIPIKRYGSTQYKIEWGTWDKKARKWGMKYVEDPTRVTSMSNEASFTQIMTKDVFDAVKAWTATGQTLTAIYPDNPRHIHLDAKSIT